MNVTSKLTELKKQSSDLPISDRARFSCRLAKQFEKAGEYEAAWAALSEFWPQRDQPPKLDDLDEPEKAEILLRVGALAGWFGAADQTRGTQEIAKDFITQSLEIFEGLDQADKRAEAHGDLALCYWREGSYDEARIHLENALTRLGNDDSELKAVLLIRAGIVEEETLQLQSALRFYFQAEPLLEKSEDHALKGAFHNEFATLFIRLGTEENRRDYLDRALIEAAAASFHFEEAGNSRFLARVENNLGYLYFTIGQYRDAHQHLDRARHLFLRLKDRGTAAEVDETRARTLLAEGHLIEAERIARGAVRVFERGDQQARLAEALTTHGVALVRLGKEARGYALLERAIEVAETTGDFEGAGRARLSIIEELEEKIPAKDLISTYRAAIEQLKGSQDPSTGKRLIACADRLLDTCSRLEVTEPNIKEHNWEGFSFKQHIHAGERAVIEQALRDSGGSVSKASRLLGFKHHQSLISLLNTRHKELLKTRSTVRRRRRHLFSAAKPKNRIIEEKPRPTTGEISVLHVEDNKAVARLLQDTLGDEGLRVDSCTNGAVALEVLKGKTRYDAIVVDNDLPGLSGLELVLRVRSMSHRRNTPIIMLSGDNCEKEAWRAGVSDFLRKPGGVGEVSSTITRLLEERKAQKNNVPDRRS